MVRNRAILVHRPAPVTLEVQIYRKGSGIRSVPILGSYPQSSENNTRPESFATKKEEIDILLLKLIATRIVPATHAVYGISDYQRPSHVNVLGKSDSSYSRLIIGGTTHTRTTAINQPESQKPNSYDSSLGLSTLGTKMAVTSHSVHPGYIKNFHGAQSHENRLPLSDMRLLMELWRKL